MRAVGLQLPGWVIDPHFHYHARGGRQTDSLWIYCWFLAKCSIGCTDDILLEGSTDSQSCWRNKPESRKDSDDISHICGAEVQNSDDETPWVMHHYLQQHIVIFQPIATLSFKELIDVLSESKRSNLCANLAFQQLLSRDISPWQLSQPRPSLRAKPAGADPGKLDVALAQSCCLRQEW